MFSPPPLAFSMVRARVSMFTRSASSPQHFLTKKSARARPARLFLRAQQCDALQFVSTLPSHTLALVLNSTALAFVFAFRMCVISPTANRQGSMCLTCLSSYSSLSLQVYVYMIYEGAYAARRGRGARPPKRRLMRRRRRARATTPSSPPSLPPPNPSNHLILTRKILRLNVFSRT